MHLDKLNFKRYWVFYRINQINVFINVLLLKKVFLIKKLYINIGLNQKRIIYCFFITSLIFFGKSPWPFETLFVIIFGILPFKSLWEI